MLVVLWLNMMGFELPPRTLAKADTYSLATKSRVKNDRSDDLL